MCSGLINPSPTNRSRRLSRAGAIVFAAALLCGAARAGDAPQGGTPDAVGMPAPGKTLSHSSVPVPEPEGYRLDRYREPVPSTLKGARVITTEEAERIWTDRSAIFIDVFPKAPKPPNLPAGTIWRDPSHMSIKGGRWLPNVGLGVLAPEAEAYFRARLAALTQGDTAKAVVFYCQKDCWLSWNAAKRAVEWGYSTVIWFPDGSDGWSEAGNDLVYLTAEP